MNPVGLGDALREGDVEPPTIAPPIGLCENCFHEPVCAVVRAIKTVDAPIAVGFCPFHLPVLEEESNPDDALG